MKKSKVALILTAVVGLVGAGVGVKKFLPRNSNKYLGEYVSGERILAIQREGNHIVAEYSNGDETTELTCTYEKDRDILQMSNMNKSVVIWLAKAETENHFISVKQFEAGSESNIPVVWHKIEKEV